MPPLKMIRKDILEMIQESQATQEIPHDLHFFFYDLAKKIANKPCFINYTYKDDFISASYVKCLNAVFKYKIKKALETKKNHPYGYFTTTIYNNILTMIGKEETELVKKEMLRTELFNSVMTRYPDINTHMLFEDA